MIGRGVRIARKAPSCDRTAVSLIWLLGLAPILFPAAVFASAAILGPGAALHPAPSMPSTRPFQQVALAPSAGPSKLELRALDPLRLGRGFGPESFGAPRPLAGIRRAGFRPPLFAPAHSGSSPDMLSVLRSGWVMKRFASVKVLQGLRLGSGSMVVALAGLEPPAPDAKCKRIDGVVESCLRRAASRLQVLVRGRPVSCQIFHLSGPEGKVGRCMAGKIDLAADLIRNGLARRG